MNDKNFRNLALVVGSAGLLYWLYKRRQAQLSATPVAPDPQTANTPIDSVYSSNPNAFDPPSLGNINITIANQGLAGLTNQYIPLFGMVGIADTTGIFPD